MGKKGLYIQFKTKWTGQAALVLSLLYLLNPFYTPLNIVLHEAIAFFESPNTAIGHLDDSNAYQVYKADHEHETMQLDNGHELVDFVGLALENSEDKNPSDESLTENVKCDKHIPNSVFIKHPFDNSFQTAKYWSYLDKSRIGYPFEAKAPPRLS